jgi:hypothetical protein
VRAFLREALPQLLGGSVVSHHHLSTKAAANATVFRIRSRNCAAFQGDGAAESGLAISKELSLRGRCAPGRSDFYCGSELKPR